MRSSHASAINIRPPQVTSRRPTVSYNPPLQVNPIVVELTRPQPPNISHVLDKLGLTLYSSREL